eukprot:767629-Hanusia_phi.AAC.1
MSWAASRKTSIRRRQYRDIQSTWQRQTGRSFQRRGTDPKYIPSHSEEKKCALCGIIGHKRRSCMTHMRNEEREMSDALDYNPHQDHAAIVQDGDDTRTYTATEYNYTLGHVSATSGGPVPPQQFEGDRIGETYKRMQNQIQELKKTKSTIGATATSNSTLQHFASCVLDSCDLWRWCLYDTQGDYEAKVDPFRVVGILTTSSIPFKCETVCLHETSSE